LFREGMERTPVAPVTSNQTAVCALTCANKAACLAAGARTFYGDVLGARDETLPLECTARLIAHIPD
jgi:hypothetical protein